jgi:hypothetical protein
MWAYHKNKDRETVQRPETVQLRILAFRDAKQRGRVPRVRARSKQVKDQVHEDLHAERRRLFREAYHDQLESRGEVDALTSSPVLGIDPAEVLTDPKLRYEHPQLTKLFSPMSLDEQILLMGGRSLSGRSEDAGYGDRYSFFPKKRVQRSSTAKLGEEVEVD